MLADKRLTVDEAERLLSALDRTPSDRPGLTPTGSGSHLRVLVTTNIGAEDDAQTVNLRVPIATLRAGLWLPGLVPEVAAEGINGALADRGIRLDVRKLRERDIDRFIDALRDLEIDIVAGDHRVLVFVE